MDLRAAALTGAGLLVSGIAAVSGGLGTGYGLGPFAILLRIGLWWLALGALTAFARPNSIKKATKHAVTGVLILFVIGCSLMYYDLAVTPPENGTTLTLSLLVSYQLQFLLITLPIPAGYLAGVLVSDDKPLVAALTFLAVLVASPMVSAQIAVAGGFAPGFAGAFFFTATVVVSGFALVPLCLMGWIDPGARTADIGTVATD